MKKKKRTLLYYQLCLTNTHRYRASSVDKEQLYFQQRDQTMTNGCFPAGTSSIYGYINWNISLLFEERIYIASS